MIPAEPYTAVPDADRVESVLQDLQIDPVTIEQVIGLLERARKELDREFLRVPGRAFGPSSSGSEMAFHTDGATNHVVAAIAQMMAGLDAKKDAVRALALDGTETDLSVSDALTFQQTLTDAVTCVAAPDVKDNPACTLPTDVTPVDGF